MSDGSDNSLSVSKREHLRLAIQLGYDCRLGERDIETIRNRVNREGITFLTKEIPKLGKAMLSGISTGVFQTPAGFRTKKGTVLPLFMFDVFSQIFSPDGRYLADRASDRAVADVHQFTGFFYKMEIPFSAEQEAEYSRRFLDTDAEVWQLEFDELHPVLRNASALVSEIFYDFDPAALVCKDGPGATANSTFLDKKTRKLDKLPITRWKYLHHFFVNVDHMASSVAQWPDCSSPESEATSKVIFVPKDSRGPRVISAEPRECQFVQQGLRQYMYKAIQSHSLTRNDVHFGDQTFNAGLAMEASIDKTLATLDLSEASDRVSMRLVEILFSGVPSLLEYLKVSRSVQTKLSPVVERRGGQEVTLFKGTTTRLGKFAPMGSAVCFPVLAIVIWSLLKAKQLLLRGDNIENGWATASDVIAVYGDDIVVDSTFALDAIETLEEFGLRVNVAKSFVACDFAESCGTDAYKGRRITPVRLRKPVTEKVPLPFNKVRRLTLDAVSHVETCNQLAAEGRYGTALTLAKLVERDYGAIPFGYPHSPYVCFHKGTILEERLRVPDAPRKARYFTIREVTDTNQDETGWSHLLRTIHSLGVNANLPDFGEYSIPRGVEIAHGGRPKWESPFEQCTWLPGPNRNGITLD